MLARVRCPACQYKISIPEGEMTKRQVCPNCQSPFFAGTSETEAAVPASSMLSSRPQRGNAESEAAGALQPGYSKTMLADTAPPIKYNCPRCRAPLEAPVSEAGTKKPCPACGQRLQVPAAPPPPVAAQPNLAKTMLAGDDSRTAPAAPPITYNCPNCKKPLESPASEAGTKKPCPFCSQRLQVPAAAPAPVNKTMLATNEGKAPPAGVPAAYPIPGTAGAPPAAGAPAAAVPTGKITIGSMTFTRQQLAIGAGVLFLLLIVVPALVRGGKVEDTAALAKAQQELEKLKGDIEQKKGEGEKLKQYEADIRRQLDDMNATIRRQDEKMRDDHRQAMSAISDDKKRAEQERIFADATRRWEDEKREMAAKQQKLLEENKAKQEENQKALLAAQQQKQVIIQQPTPYYYYHPWDYRYYYPW